MFREKVKLHFKQRSVNVLFLPTQMPWYLAAKNRFTPSLFAAAKKKQDHGKIYNFTYLLLRISEFFNFLI